MLISEIFSSIDGEAKRAGELATFVRSIGCNLRCKYCDSTYTFKPDSKTKNLEINQIIDKCKKLKNNNVTFTGGEPLIQPDADKLINSLSDNGFDVGIETNGSIDFTERDWFKNNKKNVWVCADYKCGASGMEDRMISLNKFALLREQDVLKFVVGSKKDLDRAFEIIKYIREKGSKCFVYLSPVFGKIKPHQIVDYMKKNNLQNKIRFQLQLHKFVWDPQLRGV